MTSQAAKKNCSRIFIFFCAMALLILGVALILKWWPYLAVVFKGAIGVVLALAALCLFVLAKE